MAQQILELNAKMSQEHLDVLNLIKNCKNNAITRKEIVAALGKDAHYYRKLNIIINELVVVFREPIGSSSSIYRNGYFYCKDDKDFYLAKKSLISRIESVNERMEVLKKLQLKRRDKLWL